jgi:catechol 2,3-dioxygenase-like lactoylglutathione lyase family enzyme
MFKTTMLILASALVPAGAFAQLAEGNERGVSMGHLHLNAKDPELQRKFWVDFIGAQPAKLGPLDVYTLPGVIVMVNKTEPSAGTVGSVINHIGLTVRDLKPYPAKAADANVKIETQSETQLMLLAPDDIRVELTADPASPHPVANHHVHFYVADVEATRKWYAATFGAIPGKRGKFEAADLPGVNLSFTKADTALAGTKGRSLDHIGFEVKDLESFTQKLEASGIKFNVPYRKVPRLGIAIAFLTDPWGTYIELTEGLNSVK